MYRFGNTSKARIGNIMKGQERLLISLASFPQTKTQVFNEDSEKVYFNPWDEANKRAS